MRAGRAEILRRLAAFYRGDAPGGLEPPFTPDETADALEAGAAALGAARPAKREKLAAKRAKLKGGAR